MSLPRFMAWACPVLSAKQWLTIFVATLLGALAAGLYGALHDQITFSISPEYFTAMKFPQFGADAWPFPERLRVALIGFLASWWLGAAIGFLLARISIVSISKQQACRQFGIAFSLVFLITALFGFTGGLLRKFQSSEERQRTLQEWSSYQFTYDLIDLPAFVQTAQIHLASYLGAAVGLLLAIIYLSWQIFMQGKR